MKMILTTRFEKISKQIFITRSVKNAHSITTILFHDMEKPVVHPIDGPVNKFPIDTAGNKDIMDKIIKLKKTFAVTVKKTLNKTIFNTKGIANRIKLIRFRTITRSLKLIEKRISDFASSDE